MWGNSRRWRDLGSLEILTRHISGNSKWRCSLCGCNRGTSWRKALRTPLKLCVDRQCTVKNRGMTVWDRPGKLWHFRKKRSVYNPNPWVLLAFGGSRGMEAALVLGVGILILIPAFPPNWVNLGKSFHISVFLSAYLSVAYWKEIIKFAWFTSQVSKRYNKLISVKNVLRI